MLSAKAPRKRPYTQNRPRNSGIAPNKTIINKTNTETTYFVAWLFNDRVVDALFQSVDFSVSLCHCATNWLMWTKHVSNATRKEAEKKRWNRAKVISEISFACNLLPKMVRNRWSTQTLLTICRSNWRLILYCDCNPTHLETCTSSLPYTCIFCSDLMRFDQEIKRKKKSMNSRLCT